MPGMLMFLPASEDKFFYTCCKNVSMQPAHNRKEEESSNSLRRPEKEAIFEKRSDPRVQSTCHHQEAFPPSTTNPAESQTSGLGSASSSSPLTLSSPSSPAMSSLRAISSLLHIYSSSSAAGRGARLLGFAPALGGNFRVPSSSGPPAFVLDEVARAACGARRRASTRAASWDSEKSPYETLELGRDADEETIKTAYRRLAKFYHPDVYDGKGTLEEGETAEARFIKIQAAYELLIDNERRKAYDREHHVNPMKASQAWMEWVMKKRKAFDQRGDMAVAAWAEQQQREMTLRARRLSRSKVDPEEERRLFAKEKKASMEFYSTTLKRHTLVLRKRDIMRKKAEEDRNKEISRLLAAEGLELDTDEDEDKNFLG